MLMIRTTTTRDHGRQRHARCKGGGFLIESRTLSQQGLFCAQEDEQLKKLVAKHGPRNWSVMAKQIPGRTGKSCRLRWGVGTLCRGTPNNHRLVVQFEAV